MKMILKCSLCGADLNNSQKVLLKNIPESAQGFLKEEPKILKNYSKTIPEACQKPVKNIRKICKNHPRIMSNTKEKY